MQLLPTRPSHSPDLSPIETLSALLAKATESSPAHPSGGSGEPEIWWGFSSCSTNMQPVMTFLGQNPNIMRVLYIVEGGSSARDVRRYSAYQGAAGQQENIRSLATAQS